MPCHPESRAAIGFLANTFQVNRTVLKAIQELQRVRNFLRNERERLRLEIVEHLRLTQAAMGSAKAVSASVASFGTVAEDFGKSRAAV
jgi:hypothetical protein